MLVKFYFEKKIYPCATLRLESFGTGFILQNLRLSRLRRSYTFVVLGVFFKILITLRKSVTSVNIPPVRF